MSPSRSTSHASSILSRSPSREGRPPTPRHPPEFSPTLPAPGEDLVDDPPNLLDVEGLRQKRQPRALLSRGPAARRGCLAPPWCNCTSLVQPRVRRAEAWASDLGGARRGARGSSSPRR